MHATDLIDLAGFVSTHSRLLASAHSPQAPYVAEKYWASSKCRLDRWARSLKLFQQDTAIDDPGFSPWPAIELIGSEVLASEILTRVWTAVGCIHDREQEDDFFEPILRSVLIGHLEARNRVLKLISIGHTDHRPEAIALNRLRNKAERWTDLLLGSLNHTLAASFGFDQQRVEEFAADNYQLNANHEFGSWHLMMESLHRSFTPYRDGAAINGDLNEDIFGSVMSCFPPEVFDSTGPYHSLWILRIGCATDQTERFLENYLRSESPTT